MSSSNSIELTEEHEKFLKSLEEEFKDRYTENDEEFKAVLNEKPTMPPIVENWVNFRQRDGRRGNYRDYREHDRDRERLRGTRHNYGGGIYPHSSRQYYSEYRPH